MRGDSVLDSFHHQRFAASSPLIILFIRSDCVRTMWSYFRHRSLFREPAVVSCRLRLLPEAFFLSLTNQTSLRPRSSSPRRHQHLDILAVDACSFIAPRYCCLSPISLLSSSTRQLTISTEDDPKWRFCLLRCSSLSLSWPKIRVRGTLSAIMKMLVAQMSRSTCTSYSPSIYRFFNRNRAWRTSLCPYLGLNQVCIRRIKLLHVSPVFAQVCFCKASSRPERV